MNVKVKWWHASIANVNVISNYIKRYQHDGKKEYIEKAIAYAKEEAMSGRPIAKEFEGLIEILQSPGKKMPERALECSIEIYDKILLLKSA